MLQQFLAFALRNVFSLLWELLPFLCVILAFGVFVLINGSIVVGTAEFWGLFVKPSFDVILIYRRQNQPCRRCAFTATAVFRGILCIF